MIKQNSAKWHNLKKSRIGSSEIFTLVSYYNTQEQLQNAGVVITGANAESYERANSRYNGALIGLTLARIVLPLYTILNIVNTGHNAAALCPCQPQLLPECHPHISTRSSNDGWFSKDS